MKVAIHLGLGDAIVCAPIIAKLAQDNEAVEIPCWKHNEVSVKSFFVNYPNVKVLSFENETDYNIWIGTFDLTDKMFGYYSRFSKLPTEDFVQWFYRQANFDINEKQKYCPIYEASKQFDSPKHTHIFVHDDIERIFKIDMMRVNGNSFGATSPVFIKWQSILINANWLINASEIHCIDSCFLHLSECLPTKGKLFYHKYARPDSPDYKYLKKEWTVLN